jgi:hypothetical protein
MTLKEIQALARERGLRPGRLGKTELVRALQQQENCTPCYQTGMAAACGQLGCLLRSDCR